MVCSRAHHPVGVVEALLRRVLVGEYRQRVEDQIELSLLQERNAFVVIGGKNRFAGAPDIPTMAEAGLPGFESEYWVGMLAPARVAAPLVARISREVVDIPKTPEMQAALLAHGAESSPKTPVEFAEFIRSETVKMKKIIDLAGMRVK